MLSNTLSPISILLIFSSFTTTTTLLFTTTNLCQAASPNAYHEGDPGLEPHEIDTFNAIRILHNKLDVDSDGEVDDFESKRFLESGATSSSGNNKNGAYSNAHKLKYLHQDGKDRSISVDELWQAWKSSNVYNWTIDETVYWLVNYVELPEFSEIFSNNAINGSLLPRLAADSQFVNKLGISDPSAKKKISIKAMDVVLFGPPKLGNSSKIRDFIVSIVTLIAVSACVVFYKRSIASQKALLAMQENLESLQKAEDQMQELQQELEKAQKAQEAVVTEKKNLEHQLEMHRQFSASSNLADQAANKSGSKQSLINLSTSDTLSMDAEYVAKIEDEVKKLRKELDETYSSMEARKFRAPFPLRSLLKATYNIESQYYQEKKLNLESKATEVKLRNQKLQKKKTSFLGYYKMAQENSLEEDLNTIVEVKEAIMQVTKEIKQRTDRWRAIEELCGCSLDLTPPSMRA
jgi:stromal interaction molecule 1